MQSELDAKMSSGFALRFLVMGLKPVTGKA